MPAPYSSQISAKEQRVRQQLAAFPEAAWRPFCSSEPVHGSRTRVKMVVSGSVSAPVIGIPEGHGGSELLDCPLHHPVINSLLQELKALIKEVGLEPYRVSERRGELKFLHVKYAPSNAQAIVRLVMRSQRQRSQVEQLSERLRARRREVSVVSLNIQPEHKAIVEGAEEFVLSPAAEITEKLDGIVVIYPPQSFSQVTTNIAEKLYRFVALEVAQRAPASLCDLFCGVGAFALFSAPFVPRVRGLEISAEAVRCARIAAQQNGFTHLIFEVADLLQPLTPERLDGELLIVNPPRRGLGAALAEDIIRSAARTVIYSSCSPESLTRDLELLAPRFAIEKFAPFDMFPQTPHLEVVAVLSRR